MKLFAVTYTDPSEPWGAAIYQRKLYRTPGELLTALNDCYDEFVAGSHGDYLRKRYVDPAWALNYANRSLDEVLVDEFDYEYGVGQYELVGS